MTRTVQCRKYKQELPGLDRAPYPGPKGEDIFANVSKQAWDEWQKHQTMLINEHPQRQGHPGDATYRRGGCVESC